MLLDKQGNEQSDGAVFESNNIGGTARHKKGGYKGATYPTCYVRKKKNLDENREEIVRGARKGPLQNAERGGDYKKSDGGKTNGTKLSYRGGVTQLAV